MFRSIAALAIGVLVAGCGGGSSGAGTTATAPTAAGLGANTVQDDTAYGVGPNDSLASAVDGFAVTHHTITLGTSLINYTASTGHLVVVDPVSKLPEATMFFVAYTLDGANPKTRPVTFFYNGGPGSSTVWLHLGSFGPRRLVTGDPTSAPPIPYQLVENADSLLGESDLVYIDAVGTGWSEAINPYTNQSFWSVDRDAGVFRDFVVRYVSAFSRQLSPKILFGESYGTTRTPILAHDLEIAGIDVDGIVLQSSILNYNTNCGVLNSASISCAGYLPTYAIVGGYYGRDQPNPTDNGSYAQQMRTFTQGTYAPADTAWLSMAMQPSLALASELDQLTGISTSLWQSDLNLLPALYQSNLIPGTLIGRYDARVSAPQGSALAQGGDPSSSIITAAFSASVTTYLAGELGYVAAVPYVLQSNAINTWDFSHDGQSLPDVIPDLATALALNPSMRIISLNGYHDLATPFYQTELDLARLGSVAGLAINHYDGGHMTYLDDNSRPIERADLIGLYAGLPGHP